MERMMRKILTALLFILPGQVFAATVTIDFDDLPLGGTPIGGDFVEVVTQGFSFVSEVGVGAYGDPGNQAIVGFSSGIDFDTGEIYISRVDGEAFALLAADVDGVSSFGVSCDVCGDFSGEFGTGGWLNITSVAFFGDAPAFSPVSVDNFMAGTAVPVPAAVWLFGSALVGLGFVRRKA
jgi:hypothetical protein